MGGLLDVPLLMLVGALVVKVFKHGPRSCPAGYHWDSTVGSCVADTVSPPPVDTSCPTGYHWDSTLMQCVADVITPPPSPTYAYIDNPTSPVYLFQKSYIIVRNGNITTTKGNNSYCVNMSYCDNVGIEGGLYQTASRPIEINNCSNVHVFGNIQTRDSSIENLKVNYSTDVLIEDIATDLSSDNGLDVGFNTRTRVNNAFIRNAGMNGNGIDTDGTNSCKLSNIDVAGGVNSALNGVLIQHSKYVEVAGGYIHDNAGTGLTVINSYTPMYIHDVNFSNNHPDVWVGGGMTVYFDRCTIPKLSKASNAIVYIDKGPPPGWVSL